MAIIGSVFAMIGRFAGRLLNSALGWATLLLFGKVEGRKQTILLVIALGSLVWILTIVGVLVPALGAFLLAFVPIPDGVQEDWVRLGMLALALRSRFWSAQPPSTSPGPTAGRRASAC